MRYHLCAATGNGVFNHKALYQLSLRVHLLHRQQRRFPIQPPPKESGNYKCMPVGASWARLETFNEATTDYTPNTTRPVIVKHEMRATR